MTTTRIRVSAHIKLCGIALALAVIQLPGLVHPQAADAQRAGQGRGMARGGARFMGGLRGGRWGGGRAQGVTRYYRPSMQMRAQTVRRSMMGGRTPANWHPSSRSVFNPSFNPYGSAIRQPGYLGYSATGFNRALPGRSLYSYPYNNHARLYPLSGSGWNVYFPYRSVYYPNYYLNSLSGITVPSVYYYYATFPPYIGASSILFQPPQLDCVPNPIYSPDGVYQGDFGNDSDAPTQYRQQEGASVSRSTEVPNDNSVRVNATEQDPLLAHAISDIVMAWNNADIQALAKHVHRDAPLAVYLRGKYFYSLDGGDYLSMTRDAFYATRTVSFTLDKVEYKSKGIYTVGGSHIYADAQGKNHTVLVSYVLQKVDGDYYLAQVGSTPQELEQ